MKTKLQESAIEIPKGYSAVSLDELKDELLGETGTSERDIYEAELREEEPTGLLSGTDYSVCIEGNC